MGAIFISGLHCSKRAFSIRYIEIIFVIVDFMKPVKTIIADKTVQSQNKEST